MMRDALAWSGRRVLVTGARGFLGAHVVRRLLELGAEVHGAARATPTALAAGLTWHVSDLSEQGECERLLRVTEPEYIFHLAGYAEGMRGREHVLPSFYGDLATTVNLLTAAAESQPRLVLAGSLEEPSAEETEPIPSSPYAAAKWAASSYARMFRSLYDMPVVNCRVFMTYGPGQRTRKLIPYVIRSFLAGESPRLASGRRPVDWVFVDDLVDGLLAAAQCATLPSRPVDLGSGILTPIRDVVTLIRDELASGVSPEFGALPDPSCEQVKVARVDDTFAAIGWRPAISLSEGLRRTITWYQQHPGPIPNFQETRRS